MLDAGEQQGAEAGGLVVVRILAPLIGVIGANRHRLPRQLAGLPTKVEEAALEADDALVHSFVTPSSSIPAQKDR